MRLWSIHPKYLDAKGLVALWREALLAKKVLQGRTKGYKHHPQLTRFRKSAHPLDSINQYLAEVFRESVARDYKFSRRKINWTFTPATLRVTKGQIEYERKHLLKKLKTRDPLRYKKYKTELRFASHPLFRIVNGGIENWEVIGSKK